MNRIKVLSKETADKIAAGEVIESPLSVVKELVENAIDAEADQIVVEIKNGGKDYIRVSDNGTGIMKEDLRLSVFPHATSKIRFAEDLDNILSLGFRGEALSSIAAVSNTEILSKTEDDKTGRKLIVSGGQIEDEADAACDRGTTVIVKDLFFNLPARRKFLRSETKEAASISDLVSKISLAYPSIRFRFISDGVIRFSTPGKGDIYQTILTVYSPQNARKLLKLSTSDGDLKLSGYISSPLESRNNRKQQIFFVNGRLVDSAVLTTAVKNAYSDKLFEGRYPSVYLFYDLDPSDLDVNIHPRKAEIKFHDEERIFEFTVRAIREVLLDKNATQILDDDISDKHISTHLEDEKVNPSEEEHVVKTSLPASSPAAGPGIIMNYQSGSVKTSASDLFKDLRTKYEVKEEQTQLAETVTENYEPRRLIFASLNPIAQVFRTYILASGDADMYIIDQHAAHERVMYERLLNSFNDSERAGQILLAPMIIELTRTEMITAEEYLPMLSDMSFSLELFGESSYLVKEIPYFMEADEAQSFLEEFFRGTEEYKQRAQIRRDEIIMRSCKSAVKAHDKLSYDEMKALFFDLDKCKNPYSCPHGRPTFIKLSEYDLEKMFKRK